MWSCMKDTLPWRHETMGSLRIQMWLLAVLCASVCGAAPVSDGLEVLVRSPVSVHHGRTTTLPCWLNPPQSAEGVEVRWYRGDDHYDSPVLLYRNKKLEHAAEGVSFGLKDAESGGVTAGDVSLKLENATLEDAGDYTCYVSSEKVYDSASVSLMVTGTGSPPLLSAAWKDNMVNLSCESGGWYPEPGLRWSDQKQVLTPKSLKHSKDSSGLVSVHSWLLVPGSSEVSCSVGLSGEEAKDARVRLDNTPPPAAQEDSGSSVAGWVAFAVLLIVILALLGVLYFKKRVKKTKSESKAEESQTLLPQGVTQTAAREYFVKVSFDNVGNKYVIIKDNKLRDAQGPFPDGEAVTCVTAVKGTPGFSSGQHYWEVSMGNTTTGLKESWWVGVTSASVIPQDPDFTPTVSKGFWFLSSSPQTPDRFQFNTEPKVFLPVCPRPQTVGVYLNYDSGELSFYNVERKSLIGSLTAKFTGEVFPFFNPGKGDKSPMTILQSSRDQGQSSDTGNCVDPAPQETES